MNKRRVRKTAPAPPQLKGRLAVEIRRHTAISEPGADLLEQIDISGSLSQAARQLHFSYRYAWLLVDAMNRAWGEPLVATATGGKRGGGAALTELGNNVLSAYRNLQLELEHFLDQQTPTFQASIPRASPKSGQKN